MTAEKMMALAVELEAWSRNISDIPWSPWRLETRIKLEKAAKALRASAVGAGAREALQGAYAFIGTSLVDDTNPTISKKAIMQQIEAALQPTTQQDGDK